MSFRALVVALLFEAPAHADVTAQPAATSLPPLVVRPLLGPFASVREACAKLRGSCDLTPLASAPAEGAASGAFVFITSYVDEHSDDGARLAHVAVSMHGRWYVAPDVARGWNDFLRHSTMTASLRWVDVVPGGAAELRAEIAVSDASHDTPRAEERIVMFVGAGPSGRPTSTPPLHEELRRTRGYPIGGVPYQSSMRQIAARDGALTVQAIGDTIGAPIEPELIGRHALVFP